MNLSNDAKWLVLGLGAVAGVVLIYKTSDTVATTAEIAVGGAAGLGLVWFGLLLFA
jgi:hypothetical protein